MTTQTQTSPRIVSIDAERFRKAVFFRITIRRFGNRAKITNAKALEAYLTQKRAEEATDGQAVASEALATLSGSGVTATKRLIKSAALDALNEHLTKCKNTLLSLCNPSNIQPGLFVTSVEQVQRFETILEQAIADMQLEFLPAFETDFAPAIERARVDKIKDGGLGPLFNLADYPTQEKAAACFGIEWNWLSLNVPENLPAELRAAQQEKLERQFSEAAEQVQLALREGMSELIKHATEKLTPGEDGKKKIFRDTLIGNISEFIETFSARNIMGDVELAGLVDKARTVLTGITGKPGQKTADVLRTNDEQRETTRQQFVSITNELDKMIETQQSRAFNFEQD